MSFRYHTQVATATAGLRAVADVLDTAGDFTIATTTLHVIVQVLPADAGGDASAEVRAATIQRLCALLGVTPVYKRVGHYGSPYDTAPVEGVLFSVFGETVPPGVIDAAHAAAWAMTCETSGCTNLPDPGCWFCTACGVAPIVALVSRGAS